MRRRISFLLIGLLGCGVVLAEVTNRVVARVNDRILTLYDFETRFQEALRRVGDLPADETEREELMGQVNRKGLTIVPLRLYIKGHVAKVALALARGKRLYEKKQVLIERAVDREIRRTMKGG